MRKSLDDMQPKELTPYEVAYQKEKRNLEIHILRENYRYNITQTILDRIDATNRGSRPNYKYEDFNRKIEIVNRFKGALSP